MDNLFVTNDNSQHSYWLTLCNDCIDEAHGEAEQNKIPQMADLTTCEDSLENIRRAVCTLIVVDS